VSFVSLSPVYTGVPGEK